MTAFLICSITSWHGWSWSGWSALVAVGTIALALSTYVLVRGTRRLAQASDAELRAQWRPVLVGRELDQDLTGTKLNVYNVGSGPALGVRVELDA